MFSNFFRTAWRNLSRDKGTAMINIGGLAVGMAVTMLIGLWILDEVSFDRSHSGFDRIAQIMKHTRNNGEIRTLVNMPYPLGAALRYSYGADFKYVVMSTNDLGLILSNGDKKIIETGRYMDAEVTDMLSLQMIRGSRDGLKDPASILLSRSSAKALLGNSDPIGQMVKINNSQMVKVTGVYQDLPLNSSFANLACIAPWDLYVSNEDLRNAVENPWANFSWQTYVQVADNTDMDKVSAKIGNLLVEKAGREEAKRKTTLFLQPMSKWHLFGEFRDGVNTGGRIRYVWLFGLIGLFVLLLACINFMNLSTARSDKRAKEVGIRKTIGSKRSQLIWQFYSESFLVALLAFALSLLLVQITLPFFNEMAAKNISIAWENPRFWLIGIGFSMITGLLAGSYPALYLSSFQPIRVLKGVFRAGKSAVMPRKVLVVLQFTVSVTLIICTVVVFRQIRFARNRPVGYSREGLVAIRLYTPDIHQHFDAISETLKESGMITAMAETWDPITAVWASSSGLEWKGKDPTLAVDFPNNGVSPDYGRTVGWEFKEGRDFSKRPSDSTAFVINETAVKFMGLTDPVGQTIRFYGRPFTIIGVIRDVVTESPYDQVRPSFFHLNYGGGIFAMLRINPGKTAGEAMPAIEQVFNRFSPAQPFDYKFIDGEYAQKFAVEQRIGKLAGFFAFLAIFISCLGLFGIASFMAEQRSREIGIRKVLGASVCQIWGMLSRDFVTLVLIAFLIAAPAAWYGMTRWLQNYTYRSSIDAWIFVVTGFGAMLITLATVSYQSIRAGLSNPVKNIRTE